jgi:arabinose-5-phosphate isomerase
MAVSSTAAVTSKASTEADLAAARRVLEHASQGLEALGRNLGDAFVAALDICAKVAGRVIVTGVGKSGHVGRKIAATLASTGTPAFFVHAGETSHGDMGMITKGDAVLAISNSGEAGELRDVVAYTRRFGIPLIAVTSRPGSTLGQGADVVLALPPVGEACPMGLAPTTSTTLTIALGDALAAICTRSRT